MFVFGVCAGPDDDFERFAGPGIERCAERGSMTILVRGAHSLASGYNEIAGRVRDRDDLEGLILIHDDVELLAIDVCAKLRNLFADPTVGVVGTLGGRNVRSLRYWEGETFGHHRGVVDDEFSDFASATPTGTHDVDMVDGAFLALSPSVVRGIEFDERHFRGFHGYGGDYCSQVLAAHKRVVVTDVAFLHHITYSGRKWTSFLQADRIWQWKWIPAPWWKKIWMRVRAIGSPIESRVGYYVRWTRRRLEKRLGRSAR
jgi:hypothetical protein